MYINGLGMRNIEGLSTVSNGSQKTSNTGKISNTNKFENNMQKAVEAWKAITKTGGDSDSASYAGSEDFCCEQCYINSQIIDRLMTRSLYTSSLSSGMNMLGLSAYGGGSSALSAYGSTLGLLGGSIFSNIQI
ncbi:MAG: hypothetical protein NC313_04845 [Butyrivibrio sp.]|nr:hypothetical protein [Butyrivibrio sp.]